jgi:DNA-binding LacI/PurR family transcriptional regulator
VAALAPLTMRVMSPVLLLVIDRVREHLAQIGWTMELHVNRSCFTARPGRALERLVRSAPAAAWLLFGSHEPMLAWFARRRAPCLVVGTCPDGIALPFADADHRAACRHAGALLLRARHRRLALVLPEGTRGGDAESERGMREALASSPDARLVVLRHRDRSHLCRQLDRILRAPSPPSAYLVARAVHALTVVMHLQRRGVRLPQDAAVISRDDDPFFCHSSPDISRYAMNPDHFARKVSKAVRQLAETGALRGEAIRLIPKYLSGETA